LKYKIDKRLLSFFVLESIVSNVHFRITLYTASTFATSPTVTLELVIPSDKTMQRYRKKCNTLMDTLQCMDAPNLHRQLLKDKILTSTRVADREMLLIPIAFAVYIPLPPV
jgi:hypothetical protein